MLLSRVAESVYWLGRHLERAESTARLVRAHTELFLDLPKSAGLEWAPLLAVTGTTEQFDALGGHPGEDAVVEYLTASTTNPSSVMASLAYARDNLRVNRGLLPSPTWEILGELHLHLAESPGALVDRATRLGRLRFVVRQCQLIAGMLATTMTHDHTYAFLEIGRCIERADMTSRVLDVGSALLLDGGARGEATEQPYADSMWFGVLESVAADQMFRLATPGGLSGDAVIGFLVAHPQFPRSLAHCVVTLSHAMLELPRHGDAMAAATSVQKLLDAADPAALAADGLHEFVDAVQVGIGALHDVFADTYFRRSAAQPTVGAAA